MAYSPAEDNFAWRLSIAEVSASGPFSKFEGMRRVLTVIEGSGLKLMSSDRTQAALYKTPTSFCGDAEINSYLIDGPVRDFNLIYDPKKINASVCILNGCGVLELPANNTIAIYSVVGDFDFRGLIASAGSTVLGSSNAPKVEFDTSGWAIAVKLSDRTHFNYREGSVNPT